MRESDPPDRRDVAYYHGTDATVEPGTVLVPGQTIGKDNWPGMDNNWGVWMAPTPALAAAYGKNVYEVQPIGAVTDWAAENGWEPSESNDEFVAEGATVVGLVNA